MMKGTKLYRKVTVCGLWLLVFIQTAAAADLMDVYRQALESDPVYIAAHSTFLAASESIAEAKSALLPQLTSEALVNRNRINVLAGTLYVQQTYNANAWSLKANQALFNFPAWAKLQQAKAAVKAAMATYNDACQDLMLRTASQYFNVLYTKDNLDFAEAKLRANKRQLAQAQQRHEVGLDAITAVYEAQSAHDLSVAEVIAAQNMQINENEKLRVLTNRSYEHLSRLKNSMVPLVKPEPEDMESWVTAGLRQNWKLMSARYNLETSRENLRSQSAGNWPVFAVQAEKSKIFNSETYSSNFFVPAHQELSNIGVAVKFPFFQGGLVQAQTRHAQYDFQTASAQLEKAHRDIIVNSKISYNNIMNGLSKINADRATVKSRARTVESTEAQYRAGTRTMVDVVTAQQRLYEAQQMHALDQYTFINAILNLKYLAGSLCVGDLEEINAWLDTMLIDGLAPLK